MAVLEARATALYDLYSNSEQPGENDEYKEEDFNWDFRRNLIERIEFDSSLYDRMFPSFRCADFQTDEHRHYRHVCWSRVAKSVKLDQTEARVEFCRSEWNILEAQYCRYLTAKKKYGIQDIKPFKYAEEMSFLNKYIPAREEQIEKNKRRVAARVAAVVSRSVDREKARVAVPGEKRRREFGSSSEVVSPRPRERPSRKEERREEREAFARIEGYYEEEDSSQDSDDSEYMETFGSEPRWVWEEPIPMILAVKRMRCLYDPAHIYNIFPMRFAPALEKMWDSVGNRTKLWGAAKHMKKEWENQVKKYRSFKRNEKAKKKKEKPDPDWKYAPLMGFMDPYLFPEQTNEAAPNARGGSGESTLEEGEIEALPPPQEQVDLSMGEENEEAEEEEDEDKVFLLSMHADLKNMTPHSKSKAKLEIQTLLHKLSFPDE